MRQGTLEFMSKTILHADDSAAVRRWVAEQLSDPDVKVVSVADGAAALQVMRESPIDLLLTDLEMPELDGLLAGRRGSRVTHVSVLAGPGALFAARPTDFEPERRQGVTGWIVKPTDPENLRRWVRRVIAPLTLAFRFCEESRSVGKAGPSDLARWPCLQSLG